MATSHGRSVDTRGPERFVGSNQRALSRAPSSFAARTLDS